MYDVFINCLVGTLGVLTGVALFTIFTTIAAIVFSLVINSVWWVLNK